MASLVSRRALLHALPGLAAMSLVGGCSSSRSSAERSASSSVDPPGSSSATPRAAGPPIDDKRWLGRVRDKLASAHALRPPPKEGDWLADHPESGQRLEGYWDSKPARVAPDKRTLVVLPVGKMGKEHASIIALVNDYLGLYFGLDTRVEAPLDPGPPPKGASRERFGSKQLLTRWFLDDVLPGRVPADASALLAFLETDLWPGENWNYVFGEASFNHPVGVWSLHRYGDPSKGKEAFDLALLRALKIAVHETGHMFGLPHCTLYRCVQSGTNSLDETDASPLWLCPECLPKVTWVTRTDPRAHLTRTAAFCRTHGFAKDADVLEKHLGLLEQVG